MRAIGPKWALDLQGFDSVSRGLLVGLRSCPAALNRHAEGVALLLTASESGATRWRGKPASGWHLSRNRKLNVDAIRAGAVSFFNCKNANIERLQPAEHGVDAKGRPAEELPEKTRHSFMRCLILA